MQLTEENKKKIDEMTYEDLLRGWRKAPPGDPWFEGETGLYWMDKMMKMRMEPGGQEEHVRVSKKIGWMD